MPIFANVTVKIYKGMTDRSMQEIEEMGEGKYINSYTDFGFKKLFGTPLNKDLLISCPAALQERIFTRLFEQAEIARYTPEERQDYEDSLKVYRDMKNVLDTAELKGAIKEKWLVVSSATSPTTLPSACCSARIRNSTTTS